jgi:hypothetical protein
MRSKEWMNEGNCHPSNNNGELMTDVFFPSTLTKEKRKKADEMCSACPVINQCREYSVVEYGGVWAMTTERERWAEREERGIKQPFFDRTTARSVNRSRKTIVHGTVNGYTAHLRNTVPFTDGEGNPCGCREANAANVALHRKKKKERVA